MMTTTKKAKRKKKQRKSKNQAIIPYAWREQVLPTIPWSLKRHLPNNHVQKTLALPKKN